MSDVPVQVIVAAFQDEKAAKGALKALKQASREGLIKIENAAVLRKDKKGKLHIKETHDMGGGKGAALGISSSPTAKAYHFIVLRPIAP